MAWPRTFQEPLERLLLKISRMHFEAGQSKSVNANTLVNILWFKSRPTANAVPLSLCLPDSSPPEIAGYVKDLRRRHSMDAFSKSLEVFRIDYHDAEPVWDHAFAHGSRC